MTKRCPPDALLPLSFLMDHRAPRHGCFGNRGLGSCISSLTWTSLTISTSSLLRRRVCVFSSLDPVCTAHPLMGQRVLFGCSSRNPHDLLKASSEEDQSKLSSVLVSILVAPWGPDATTYWCLGKDEIICTSNSGGELASWRLDAVCSSDPEEEKVWAWDSYPSNTWWLHP